MRTVTKGLETVVLRVAMVAVMLAVACSALMAHSVGYGKGYAEGLGSVERYRLATSATSRANEVTGAVLDQCEAQLQTTRLLLGSFVTVPAGVVVEDGER